jgi:hypothetical protein
MAFDRRPIALAAILTLVGVGCTAPATSSADPSTSVAAPSTSAVSVIASVAPTVAPTPSAPAVTPDPSPDSTAPAGLARVAETQRDGIRVRIELQRNPLPAGERSWVRTVVTNRGKDDVTWFHDGCALPASINGKSLVPWSMGVDQSSISARFKTYALGGHISLEPNPLANIEFVREAQLSSGDTGCADVGISEKIRPGHSVTETLWWSGFAAPNRALPRPGALSISAYAGYYWRGRHQPESIVDHAIKLSLDAWIEAPGSDHLSPAQAVDAALADPGFHTYLDTQQLANGRAEIAWYDAARNVWEIGVMPWYETEPPRIHGVLVDGTDGSIVGPLDRAWDSARDPFP